MNTDSTAANQQGEGDNTPFDKITELEKAETARLQVEIEAMNVELEKAKADGIKRKEEAMNQYKTAATKELEELKNTELRTILTEANAKKEAKTTDVQQKAKANTKAAIAYITTEFLNV